MNILKLPGLIDIHVHLRDPGQTDKEDFYSGTSAALAGGFTTVLDMPNNRSPIFMKTELDKKTEVASRKTVSDIGFYFGSMGDNLKEFKKVKGKVFGLKLYLNRTTGNFVIDKTKLLDIYTAWADTTPILLHAEEDILPIVLETIKKTGKKSHFCHVSSESELSLIIKAKKKGLPVTCGVTPHHLFLAENDLKKLGSFGLMKPSLKSEKDRQYLWKNLKHIDVIESDHAPHSLKEKKSSNPPFGVPGLETTLPLLLTAVYERKMKMQDVVKMCFTNPKRIFNIQTSTDTFIEIDIDKTYTIRGKEMKSKSGWTPFEGWKVKGRVEKVVVRKHTVYENGKILVEKGTGKIIRPL